GSPNVDFNPSARMHAASLMWGLIGERFFHTLVGAPRAPSRLMRSPIPSQRPGSTGVMTANITQPPPRLGVADLGVGIGLRVPHYKQIIAERPAVDFFEVISENFMVDGGKPRYHLDAVLEGYLLIQHGVSMGI